MASEEEMLHRLRELDDAISSLTTTETMDSRVSFDYDITLSKPGWYKVRLYIRPKGGFNLNQIDKVIYYLHPTFRPSKIAVKNPNNQFALELESWGDFHAAAVIVFLSGELVRLIRYLPIGVDDNSGKRSKPADEYS